MALRPEDFKSAVYTIPPSGHFDSPRKKLSFFLEAWGGIEPPNKAFAELRLTTWPPRLNI